MPAKNALLKLTDRFVKKLQDINYQDLAPFVYNPLEYAYASHAKYVTLYGNPTKKVVFLGMNPGPYGMAQTGVPFGEVDYVRSWLKVEAEVGQPKVLHPKRPIQGFDCTRSEVSGRRLWGFFSEKYRDPKSFFKNYFVINYCPLIFFDADGKNLTPDKLSKQSTVELFNICNWYLHESVTALEAKMVVGVGKFAMAQAQKACGDLGIEFGHILHPSPASPMANRGWGKIVDGQLSEMGLS